jgi:hypothetical protein
MLACPYAVALINYTFEVSIRTVNLTYFSMGDRAGEAKAHMIIYYSQNYLWWFSPCGSNLRKA